MYVFILCERVRVGDSCNVMAVPLQQCVHWLATGDMVPLRKGK